MAGCAGDFVAYSRVNTYATTNATSTPSSRAIQLAVVSPSTSASLRDEVK
jgi:hypothetical protein